MFQEKAVSLFSFFLVCLFARWFLVFISDPILLLTNYLTHLKLEYSYENMANVVIWKAFFEESSWQRKTGFK